MLVVVLVLRVDVIQFVAYPPRHSAFGLHFLGSDSISCSLSEVAMVLSFTGFCCLFKLYVL